MYSKILFFLLANFEAEEQIRIHNICTDGSFTQRLMKTLKQNEDLFEEVKRCFDLLNFWYALPR